MIRIAMAVCIACFASFAAAQETLAISTQACNVALTACALIDEGGNTYDVVGSPVYDGDVTVNGVTCTAYQGPVSQTNYRIVRTLEITCDDGTVLDGFHTSTRSGSGRGKERKR
jgi:hypothetical protein